MREIIKQIIISPAEGEVKTGGASLKNGIGAVTEDALPVLCRVRGGWATITIAAIIGFSFLFVLCFYLISFFSPSESIG